ncbi:MAG: hypothetical protein EOM00_15645 [Clostridia bacterium]|nr:hypothetical protein [Clostridia bacterium]
MTEYHIIAGDYDGRRNLLLLLAGEPPMTREEKAVELLHRVLNYFLGEFAFPEKMERLLGEIEDFLTEIEAEKK